MGQLKTLQNLVDLIYGLIPRRSPSLEQCAEAKIIVHRGWFLGVEAIENTLEAFELCVDKGLYGIEFDVRWTKDLVPVIHHDPTLMRLFEDKRKISELNFDELRARFPLIPRLDEVITRFGKKIHLLIELKEEHFPELEKQRKILRETLSVLREGEDYHLLSLASSNFQKFCDYKKESMIMVSTKNPEQVSAEVSKHGYGGFMGHYFLIGDKYFKKHPGIKFGTGFPANVNTFKREILRPEVEWIFTNHPGIFLEYRKKRLLRLSLNSRL